MESQNCLPQIIPHSTFFYDVFDSISFTLLSINIKKSLSRIQDLDGRFFEKFGSLLRQKSEYAEEKIVGTPLAPLPTDECGAPDTDCQLRTIEEGENDSGTETLQDTDSEHDEQDQTKKNEEIFTDLVGLNVSIQ